MQLRLLGVSLLLACTVTARPAPADEPVTVDTEPSSDVNVASEQLDDLLKQSYDLAKASLESDSGYEKRGGCTLQNLQVRREWSTLSKQDRKAYIKAAQCLQSKPARTPSGIVPGAKTRFDDFVATHINQTNTIHYTGNFLSWHRYYTWIYERALRDECGYQGTQPYWDWSRSARSGLAKHPLFDGSDTSVSGDGVFVPNKGSIILGGGPGLPAITLPSGTGGGCAASGPFKDMKVNLGPIAMQVDNGSTIGHPEDPFRWNQRCLKRDLTDQINRRYANASSVVKLILENQDIESFQMIMQGIPGSGDIGVHGGGHYSIGGDPARDVFTSPGDPAFYFHHAMIDRTWWLWQLLSPTDRTYAISGTRTFLNQPPSENATLDDVIDLGYVTPDRPTIRDVMSTVGGEFCYVYL